MDYTQGIGKIVGNTEVVPRHFLMEIEAPFVAEKALPGQFVMVRVGSCVAPLLRRPFGIYRIKTGRGSFEILYRVVGQGTLLMSEMAAGVEIDILGPLGNGFDLEEGGEKPLLVAGGVGVAPLFNLAVALVSGGAAVTVLVGGKNKGEILSVDDLKEIGVDVMTATEDGEEGYIGYVTGLMEEVLDKSESFSAIYSCGPKPMLKKVAEISRSREMPCQLSLEALMACGFGVCLGCVVKTCSEKNPPFSQGGVGGDLHYSRVCCEGPVFRAEEIIWDEA